MSTITKKEFNLRVAAAVISIAVAVVLVALASVVLRYIDLDKTGNRVSDTYRQRSEGFAALCIVLAIGAAGFFVYRTVTTLKDKGVGVQVTGVSP